MGKIADALDRQARDAAMEKASGRIATIANTDLKLWVSDGNKAQRDEAAILYPAVSLKWGPKMQLGKFINNVGQFNKKPFIVVKKWERVTKFTY